MAGNSWAGTTTFPPLPRRPKATWKIPAEVEGIVVTPAQMQEFVKAGALSPEGGAQ